MTTAPWHWRARWLAGITFPASQRHGVSYCEYVSHAGGETICFVRLGLVSVTANTGHPSETDRKPLSWITEFKRARLGTPFARAVKCQILFDFPRSLPASPSGPVDCTDLRNVSHRPSELPSMRATSSIGTPCFSDKGICSLNCVAIRSRRKALG